MAQVTLGSNPSPSAANEHGGAEWHVVPTRRARRPRWSGRDEDARRTLTGVSRRDATKAHAQLLIDVERWYGKLRDGEKPLGIRSVRGCRTVLSAMFTAAARWGYLPMSPVERARMPKGPKWNPRSPEPEHVASRVAAAEAKDRDLGVFARMAVAIGARRGELAGLRWSAIDFEQGFVRIDSAVVSTDEDNSGKRTGARLETKDTKALREMRRRHVEAALACGVPYPADAYVWRENVEGTRPVPPDRFSYAWRRIDKAVDDGAHVRLHDLRHFHGTMLVGAGVPLPSVRDPLGHSSLTVTNIYVDGRPEWDRKSADIMGDVLDGPS